MDLREIFGNEKNIPNALIYLYTTCVLNGISEKELIFRDIYENKYQDILDNISLLPLYNQAFYLGYWTFLLTQTHIKSLQEISDDFSSKFVIQQ